MKRAIPTGTRNDVPTAGRDLRRYVRARVREPKLWPNREFFRERQVVTNAGTDCESGRMRAAGFDIVETDEPADREIVGYEVVDRWAQSDLGRRPVDVTHRRTSDLQPCITRDGELRLVAEAPRGRVGGDGRQVWAVLIHVGARSFTREILRLRESDPRQAQAKER